MIKITKDYFVRKTTLGPSIKYVTLEGRDQRRCGSLWQGEWVKNMWRNTYIFYHTYETWNLKWCLTFYCNRCILTERITDKIYPGQNLPHKRPSDKTLGLWPLQFHLNSYNKSKIKSSMGVKENFYFTLAEDYNLTLRVWEIKAEIGLRLGLEVVHKVPKSIKRFCIGQGLGLCLRVCVVVALSVAKCPFVLPIKSPIDSQSAGNRDNRLWSPFSNFQSSIDSRDVDGHNPAFNPFEVP